MKILLPTDFSAPSQNAARVVRNAPCPVLTVRHPEHEFVMP